MVFLFIMTTHEDGGRAIWLEAVTDPQLITEEERVAELSELETEHFRLGCELDDYFWNSGRPYTTLDNVRLGHEEKRMSFAWDRPDGKRGRYINDKRQRGRVLHDVNRDIRIVEKDSKHFLVGNKKRVLSPKFDSIMPIDDECFEVTSGGETGKMKLLSSEDQEAILEKRARYDQHQDTYNYQELVDLKYEIAIATLALHGVSLDPQVNRKLPSSNFQELRFNHAGSYVLMNVGASFLDIMSWGEELTHEQRHEVWRAYDGRENSVRSQGMQLSILMNAIDRGVPDFLKPYEDKIIAGIDETTEANRFFLAAVHELFERNNFRPFSIETPHTSWSVPVAMKLLEMPFDEAFPIIAPYDSSTHGSIKQHRPGAFSSDYEDVEHKVTWVLDDTSGEVIQRQLSS